MKSQSLVLTRLAFLMKVISIKDGWSRIFYLILKVVTKNNRNIENVFLGRYTKNVRVLLKIEGGCL